MEARSEKSSLGVWTGASRVRESPKYDRKTRSSCSVDSGWLTVSGYLADPGERLFSLKFYSRRGRIELLF